MLRLASLVDDEAEAVAAAAEDEDETSPSVSETFPRSALASEQTWRIPLTTEGRSGVSRTSVWLVLSKLQGAIGQANESIRSMQGTHQSAHWGNTDWNVSVHAHLITSMNAPGLKMICP